MPETSADRGGAASVDEFLAEARGWLGERFVVTDPDITAAQVVDWTSRWRGSTPAVLRPGSATEVARVVSSARARGVALVPQGGNTGLVGGSVPLAGEVVVDLRRLGELGPVDLAAAQVTSGAGVPLRRLQEHLAGSGLAFAVDLAARDSATVGGMVATNAGGLHVIRHGAMRSQLLGVEAVLGTGGVVRANLAGLEKDNTGYDLPGLLCGSEGTLGIVTAARLRLVPAPGARVVALLGVASLGAAVATLPVLRSLRDLSAVEVMLASGIEVVASHLGVRPPFEPMPACTLLVELAGEGDLLEQLGGALGRLDDAVRTSAVADDEAGGERLWRWREAHTEAAAGLGLVHKADVTLPLAAIPSFAAEVATAVEAVTPGATTMLYGHLGDGNLHVNVVGPPADDDRAIDAVLALVLDHHGSISAEHGIGTAKRRWVLPQRGPEQLAAMRAIKQALDPDSVLNPNVLLP